MPFSHAHCILICRSLSSPSALGKATFDHSILDVMRMLQIYPCVELRQKSASSDPNHHNKGSVIQAVTGEIQPDVLRCLPSDWGYCGSCNSQET